MAEKKPPNFDLPPLRVIFIIPNKETPTFTDESKWSVDCKDFLAKCLVKNQNDRPTAKQLQDVNISALVWLHNFV